jgi:hypothetical protein
MRMLVQLVICLVIAWGVIALFWPQGEEPPEPPPHPRRS